MVITST